MRRYCISTVPCGIRSFSYTMYCLYNEVKQRIQEYVYPYTFGDIESFSSVQLKLFKNGKYGSPLYWVVSHIV